MELKDLVGQHKLDAVDFTDEQIKTWGDTYEDCEVCRFRLDGITYIAAEDPDDGYRSMMRELVVDENADIKNTFAECDVVARYRTKGSYGDEDDVLELVDVKTGNVVLEVGTTAIDDYYPGFVASFHPEAMVVNA